MVVEEDVPEGLLRLKRGKRKECRAVVVAVDLDADGAPLLLLLVSSLTTMAVFSIVAEVLEDVVMLRIVLWCGGGVEF